jgi:hypothetical protein
LQTHQFINGQSVFFSDQSGQAVIEIQSKHTISSVKKSFHTTQGNHAINFRTVNGSGSGGAGLPAEAYGEGGEGFSLTDLPAEAYGEGGRHGEGKNTEDKTMPPMDWDEPIAA